MGKRTSLYEKHLDAGGKMVDFAGWDMPINYGSQIAEHKQVRERAGVFDVSHMTIVDVAGSEAGEYLRHLLSNDVAKLDEVGRALYSLMLNDDGGVVDDLIVYRMAEGYRLVVNCATREKDLNWMQDRSEGFDVDLSERKELAIMAVHGPESIDIVCSLLQPEQMKIVAALGSFSGVELGSWFIARTGYTGEKGLELILPQEQAPAFWEKLLAAGVAPVGLGARDTLRLEAGMNLYGHDMDESTSPLAANLEAAIAWHPQDRDFIGRSAVTEHKQQQQQGLIPKLNGLVLEQRGVLREGMTVMTDRGQGTITSGSFSPTLNHSIALARLPADSTQCHIELRGKQMSLRIVKPNFVRMGKKVF